MQQLETEISEKLRKAEDMVTYTKAKGYLPYEVLKRELPFTKKLEN